MSSNTSKKKFIILTSDCGFGHRSAANAISKAMEIHHPQDSSTVIINPILEQPAPKFLKNSELNYNHLVTTNPGFYRFTYEISDSRPASVLVENTLTLALYKDINQIIQEMQPNAILSTNQMFGGPTGAVLDSMKNRLPFYTVVTDLADVHAMWFNNNPDRFYVASEAVRSKAIDSGIDPKKIFISGIPVNPDYASTHLTKSERRVKLGLDPNLPTLLFVGSQRVSGILEHLQALETVSSPFQVVVIAGGDNQLFEQAGQRPWSFPIRVENFVSNMPEWMMSADLLITKAGGLILSEGLAAGLPILMIDYLPGQEEGNVKFILDQQAGEVVNNSEELNKFVIEFLKNDQKVLKQLSSNAHRCGHPDSALVIADALWLADEIQVPEAMPRLSLRRLREHIAER